MGATPAPVVEGWFTTGAEPRLIGQQCPRCTTVVFPPSARWCPNPVCGHDGLEPCELSRRGTIWSFTDAAYRPPPPYPQRTDPFVPFGIAAVELAAERIVVLGQLSAGCDLSSLQVGQAVELVVEEMEPGDGPDAPELTWRWRPVDTSDAR